jgi:hypothetical protein
MRKLTLFNNHEEALASLEEGNYYTERWATCNEDTESILVGNEITKAIYKQAKYSADGTFYLVYRLVQA